MEELFAALLQGMFAVIEALCRLLPLVVEGIVSIILGMVALGRWSWRRLKRKSPASNQVR